MAYSYISQLRIISPPPVQSDVWGSPMALCSILVYGMSSETVQYKSHCPSIKVLQYTATGVQLLTSGPTSALSSQEIDAAGKKAICISFPVPQQKTLQKIQVR